MKCADEKLRYSLQTDTLYACGTPNGPPSEVGGRRIYTPVGRIRVSRPPPADVPGRGHLGSASGRNSLRNNDIRNGTGLALPRTVVRYLSQEDTVSRFKLLVSSLVFGPLLMAAPAQAQRVSADIRI